MKIKLLAYDTVLSNTNNNNNVDNKPTMGTLISLLTSLQTCLHLETAKLEDKHLPENC